MPDEYSSPRLIAPEAGDSTSKLLTGERRSILLAFSRILHQFKKRSKSPYMMVESREKPNGEGYTYRYVSLFPDAASLEGSSGTKPLFFLVPKAGSPDYRTAILAWVPDTEHAKAVFWEWAHRYTGNKAPVKPAGSGPDAGIGPGRVIASLPGGDECVQENGDLICGVDACPELSGPGCCAPEIVVCTEPIEDPGPPPGPGGGGGNPDPCPYDPWVCEPNTGGGGSDPSPPPPGSTSCPAGQTLNEEGNCVCPEGQLTDADGNCVCPAGRTLNAEGNCVCPEGQTLDEDGICVLEPDPEPCETGNPKIDDIESKLKTMWEASNPNASDITQRKEQGGWIVDTGNGFDLVPFPDDWPVTACTVALPGNPLFLDIPDNTVGMVHSHPYSIGEDISSICRQDEKVEYQGRASGADIILQVRLAINAADKGYVSNLNDFTGVVIDKGGIRITKGGLGLNSELFGQPITPQQILDNTQNEQPCGYQ